MFPETAHDLRFWLQQAQRYGGPILELACGTGRLTIPLAQAGYQMTGLDVSEDMLRTGRAKAIAAGVAIDWVHADMTTFDLQQHFQTILLPGNALCHLLETVALDACLGRVKAHLAPSGRFVVDVLVPNLAILTRARTERFPFASYRDAASGAPVQVMASNHYAADTQVNHITTFERRPHDETEVVGALRMRMYFPQELDALLRHNGYRIAAKYGTYAEATFDGAATKQLLVCVVA